MAKINNLQQLSKDLLDVYSSLKSGSIDVKTARALSNVADKVISGTKVILSYNKVRTNIEKIELLENRK